jgi:hypothetical protein
MNEKDMKIEAAKLEAESLELAPFFDQVVNKTDWKAPIDAFCREEDLPKVTRAIEFFTATAVVRLEPVPPCKGWVRVQAKGYRAGPAA